MCRSLLFILFNCFVFCVWSVKVFGLTDWDYVLQRVESNTSNADIINCNLRPLRVSRGVYAFNGSIYTGKELDNTYSVDLKIYRSASGSSDFKATAYGIPKTTFYKFMTSIYVKMLQKDLKECTNIPQYKDEFQGPLPAGNFVYNKCIILTDGMPGHFQPGLYRATIHFLGDDVEMWISSFFEVSPKSLF